MLLRPHLALLCLVALASAGCSTTSRPVERTRLLYNEAIKCTTEEQLLLNIVRLRYTDTPSSLTVSSIAAQFEVQRSLGLTPFYLAQGAGLSDQIKTFGAVLPQVNLTSADRPTISLTPMDDGEFTRRLFTPLSLESLLYLARTTWPISTVFRLYLENLNWVPNAELASGPTPRRSPPYADFLRGVQALQALQDRGQLVFGSEERTETVGGPLHAARVTGADVLHAAQSGHAYLPDPGGRTWSLVKKVARPVVHIHPDALGSSELAAVVRTFHLRPGQLKYDVMVDSLKPFPVTFPASGVTNLDLETRSLLQVLYFVSHGVEIPPDHLARGLAPITRDEGGRVFDWGQVTRELFRVPWSHAKRRPACAHVAVQYAGAWFYIDDTDHVTKATFSLILELSRLELTTKASTGPILTLPLGGP